MCERLDSVYTEPKSILKEINERKRWSINYSAEQRMQKVFGSADPKV